jgi:signal transduction histidine kinase
MGPRTSPSFVEAVGAASLRAHLVKRAFRAVSEPHVLQAALGLPPSLPDVAMLSGSVTLADGDVHLVVCGGSPDLLGTDAHDLFRRFLPLFAQAIQRRIDGIRAAESEERERSLIIARDAAERANAAKTEFVARMSHELRTPLNAILGFAELLHTEITDERQREYLGLIDSSGKHLLGLINSVLDYSRFQAGEVPVEQIPAELRTVLYAVLDSETDTETDGDHEPSDGS